MSFQAMAWAVSQKLPTRDKFVLLMLANYADENGMAWPSVSKLCDMTGMSRHTVIDAVKNLEKDGFIKAVRQTHQGVNLPNRYELQFAPAVQNLHHPVVQELHGGSAAIAPEPIIEPIIYNNPPCIPPKGKSARGTRLPPDWSPRPEDGQDAGELAKFRDYWSAVAGQKGVKLDWDATWRNWLRNSKQWTSASRPSDKPPETYRIGHAKGVVKREPEAPPLTEEQKAERARFVERALKGFGGTASGNG